MLHSTTHRPTRRPSATTTSSTTSISRPAPSTTERAAPDRPGGTVRAHPCVGRVDEAERRARPRPTAVIHGFTRELAQTASTPARPAAERGAISAAARSMSGTSIKPKRQMIPSTDASGRSGRSVLDRELERLRSRARGPSSGDLDHLGRDVGREQRAARLDQRQRPEPGVTGPGCEVEDPLPGWGPSSSIIRSESTAVARANISRCRSQPGRDAAPGLDLLRPDVGYAATPLKAG